MLLKGVKIKSKINYGSKVFLIFFTGKPLSIFKDRPNRAGFALFIFGKRYIGFGKHGAFAFAHGGKRRRSAHRSRAHPPNGTPISTQE
jgi:hypothetical protein